jgi:hypothetical protein
MTIPPYFCQRSSRGQSKEAGVIHASAVFPILRRVVPYFVGFAKNFVACKELEAALPQKSITPDLVVEFLPQEAQKAQKSAEPFLCFCASLWRKRVLGQSYLGLCKQFLEIRCSRMNLKYPPTAVGGISNFLLIAILIL